MFDDLAEWTAVEDRHEGAVRTSSTVMLALRFSEDARLKAIQAESRLIHAQKEAEAARSYLVRTTATLEQAIQLHALGRK